jgi:enoyl-CoA hydratase
MKDKIELETAFLEPAGDGVVVLTMNRPDHANGVVPELVRDMLELFQMIELDLGVRAVVLTGAGRQFCAGADLDAFKAHLEHELPVTGEPFNVRILAPLTETLARLRPPVIAAVNGGATAGGFDLALACDLRIASSRAKLGETYVNLGLMPGNGGTYFLPRLVGTGKAAELALTGALLDAGQALELGIVNRVVDPDELQAAALELADELAAKPRQAVEATKQALRSSWHTDLRGSFNASFWTTVALQRGPDVREGIDAFLEKRPPHYNVQPEDREGDR